MYFCYLYSECCSWIHMPQVPHFYLTNFWQELVHQCLSLFTLRPPTGPECSEKWCSQICGQNLPVKCSLALFALIQSFVTPRVRNEEVFQVSVCWIPLRNAAMQFPPCHFLCWQEPISSWSKSFQGQWCWQEAGGLWELPWMEAAWKLDLETILLKHMGQVH